MDRIKSSRVRETHHLAVAALNPRGAFHAPYLAGLTLVTPDEIRCRFYFFIRLSNCGSPGSMADLWASAILRISAITSG